MHLIRPDRVGKLLHSFFRRICRSGLGTAFRLAFLPDVRWKIRFVWWPLEHCGRIASLHRFYSQFQHSMGHPFFGKQEYHHTRHHACESLSNEIA